MKRAAIAFLCGTLIATSFQLSLAQSRGSRTILPATEESEKKLPISVAAYSKSDGQLIKWRLDQDVSIVAFNVLRNGKIISDVAIAGTLMRHGKKNSAGSEFSFVDHEGNGSGRYSVEAMFLDGSRLRTNEVFPIWSEDEVDPHRPDSIVFPYPTYLTRPLSNSKLTLTQTLATEVASGAPKANFRAQTSIAARDGVNIWVREDGLYRVTRSQLENVGFNVNTDPALWQLYRAGNEQAIIVEPNGAYIEFYGNGKDSLTSLEQVYFLSVGTVNGRRIGPRINNRFNTTSESVTFPEKYTLMERNTYDNNILNGTPENWWGRLISSSGASINFTTDGLDTANTADLKVVLQGFSTSSHTISLTLNGAPLGQVTGSSNTEMSNTFTVPGSALVEGNNVLGMTETGGYSFFNRIEVDRQKKFVATNDQAFVFVPTISKAVIKGFSSSDIRVFDVTADGAPALVTQLPIENNGTSYQVTIFPDQPQIYHVVGANGTLSPIYMQKTFGSTLKSTTNAADLVIIAHRDFWAEAQSWAAYRQSQGINVKLVDITDIYDEFNYGIKSADAVTNFLKYTQNSWQTPPGYILLIGGATDNPKEYPLYPDEQGYPDYIPTKNVWTAYEETGSDEAMADFNGDGLAEIAIGRIPARETIEVTNALNKTIAWENGVGNIDINRGVIYAYQNSSDYDFGGMSQELRDQLPPTVPGTMLGSQANGPTQVVSAINTGKYMVNYSGHGAGGSWASSFFRSQDVSQLTNGAHPSLFTLLTCLNGTFTGVYGYGLSQNLLGQSGGASAVWASTGQTTPDVQMVMGKRFYLKLGRGNILRLGDLIRDAKSVVPGGHDVRISWALHGDPMLKMH